MSDNKSIKEFNLFILSKEDREVNSLQCIKNLKTKETEQWNMDFVFFFLSSVNFMYLCTCSL